MTESGKERSISEAIAERRATPSFDGSSVPDDVLSAILNAGMEAPSGYNLQPWRFIVVRTPDQKKRLREAADARMLDLDGDPFGPIRGSHPPPGGNTPPLDQPYAPLPIWFHNTRLHSHLGPTCRNHPMI